MASKLIVRYSALVVVIWLVVILYKLPTLDPPHASRTRRHAVHAEEPVSVDDHPAEHVELPHDPRRDVPTIAVNHEEQPEAEDADELTEEPKKIEEVPPKRDRATEAPPRGKARRAAVAAEEEERDSHAQSNAENAANAEGFQPGQGVGAWPRPKTSTNLDKERRDVVLQMLKDSWEGYKSHAFGKDEFYPLSKRSSNWGQGKGIGSTIVDALDTLLIAGLTDEVAEAIDWIEHELSFNQDIKLSGFETTIRVLGGLLSSYQITGNSRILEQATDLGTRLSKAFGTPSGIPDNYVNLRSGHHEGAHWNGGAAILSELGSLQMEYFTLSEESGEDAFFKKARKVVETIRPSCGGGYCPRQFHGHAGNGGAAGLGSFGDSFYEYLLKTWILTGKQDDLFKEMWDKAASHTIATSVTIGGHLIPNGKETGGVMEHLACFSGGLFALSYIHTGDEKHLAFGEKIAETCHAMYSSTASGLASDVVHATEGGGFHASDDKYILRPETVETYFYLWKATKNPKYRDWGFAIVEAINKHLKISGCGYAGAASVSHVPVRHNDNMETFWFAETLKYMYLLFSEDEMIDLKSWVFNTEAHPMHVHGAK